MRIVDYSVFNTWTVESKTENISNVIDKLIRLTAKITESYAGDIVYDIRTLEICVEAGMPFDQIMFFRECGVSSYNTEMVKKDNRHILCDDYIQTWQLIHDPETTTTTLNRVMLRKEN